MTMPEPNTIYHGNCIDILRSWPDNFVHMVVTSPPYFALRNYSVEPSIWGGAVDHAHEWRARRYYTEKSAGGSSAESFATAGPENAERLKAARWREDAWCECGAWRGCLGLEPNVQMFVQHLVDIFREIRRVLRPDGCCFINIGDSFNAYNGNRGDGGDLNARADAGRPELPSGAGLSDVTLKNKDLLLVPHRLVIALQADGWYVRNDLIWDKSEQCMPESVRDRHTRAHEFIFHLTKSEDYFWDAEAIKEPCKSGIADIKKMEEQRTRLGGKTFVDKDPLNKANASTNIGKKRGVGDPSGRNPRTVWKLGRIGSAIPWEETGVTHFATYPEELPRRCIVAATSEYGVCAKCGAQWERLIEKFSVKDGETYDEQMQRARDGYTPEQQTNRREGHWQPPRKQAISQSDSRTIGWQPICECHGRFRTDEYEDIEVEFDDNGEPTEAKTVVKKRRLYESKLPLAEHPRAKSIVLDPFMGSGTTGFVAAQLNRAFLGCEANPDYARLAERRTADEVRQEKLF